MQSSGHDKTVTLINSKLLCLPAGDLCTPNVKELLTVIFAGVEKTDWVLGVEVVTDRCSMTYGHH